jgi:hypothetical protein
MEGRTMKRRHLIEIRSPEDRNYKYKVAFIDAVANGGMVFFAMTEDEVIEYVMRYRKPEPLQLTLW